MSINIPASLALSLVSLWAVSAQAQYNLTPLSTFGTSGALAPGSRTYITSDANQRGLDVDPASGKIYLVNRAVATSVNVLDWQTGADLGALDLTGVAGGTFVLNKVGVAADGTIYAANLTTAANTANLKIYRWANASAVPTVAYDGNLAGSTLRWGDTFDVRGSGANTEIVMASGTTGGRTDVVVFKTTDGSTFNANVLTTGLGQSAIWGGVAFGVGNTFYGNASGQPLRLLTYDLGVGTATPVAYGTTTDLPNGVSPIGVDLSRNLLAGLQISTVAGTAGTTRLFDITDTVNNPVLLATDAFATTFANGNGSGSVAFGGDFVYVLNTGNGIEAFAVPEPSALALFALGGGLLLWRLVRRRD